MEVVGLVGAAEVTETLVVGAAAVEESAKMVVGQWEEGMGAVASVMVGWVMAAQEVMLVGVVEQSDTREGQLEAYLEAGVLVEVAEVEGRQEVVDSAVGGMGVREAEMEAV